QAMERFANVEARRKEHRSIAEKCETFALRLGACTRAPLRLEELRARDRLGDLSGDRAGAVRISVVECARRVRIDDELSEQAFVDERDEADRSVPIGFEEIAIAENG